MIHVVLKPYTVGKPWCVDQSAARRRAYRGGARLCGRCVRLHITYLLSPMVSVASSDIKLLVDGVPSRSNISFKTHNFIQSLTTNSFITSMLNQTHCSIIYWQLPDWKTNNKLVSRPYSKPKQKTPNLNNVPE